MIIHNIMEEQSGHKSSHKRRRNVVNNCDSLSPVTSKDEPIIYLPENQTAPSTTWQVTMEPGNHAELIASGKNSNLFASSVSRVEYEEIQAASGERSQDERTRLDQAHYKEVTFEDCAHVDTPSLKALGRAPPPPPLRSYVINQSSQSPTTRKQKAMLNDYVEVEYKKTRTNKLKNKPKTNEESDANAHDEDVEYQRAPVVQQGDAEYVLVRSTEAEDTYLSPTPAVLVRRSVEPLPKYIDQNIISQEIGGKYIQRKRKETVFIKLAFLKVGEIRTKNEDFSADVFIQAKWREKKLDRRKYTEDYEIHDIERFWNPEITIENGVGSIKESVWHVATYEQSGQAYICEKRRVKGVFSERLELKKYPFDTQKFTITIMSNRRESEVILKQDPGYIDDVSILNFVDEQEWTLHKSTEVLSQYSTFTNKRMTYKQPKLSIAMKATRKPSFFLMNIVMIMLFICSLIFTTFSVELKLVQNRLQLCFILILSNVTFKNFVSGTLPKISYMTYLDHYIIWQTAIMFLVSIWHAIVYQIRGWTSNSTANFADLIALGVFATVYVIVHLAFFVLWGITWYKQKKFKINLDF